MHTRRNPEQEQKLKAYARELRSLQTDVEARLWHLLRDRRFFGHKFRRQHAVENFILDFYCPDQHLAIELDGGQHGEQQGYDQHRDATLASLGIRVVRFWNHDVLQQSDAVLQVIFDALDTPAAPHPSPLPAGGERGKRLEAGLGLHPSPPSGGEGRGEGDSTLQLGAGGDTKALRARALAHLARRDHTRQELARKLQRAGHAEEDIETLLGELSERGWLSDKRFAESYVQQKRQRFGSAKLAHELRSRGIDDEEIEQALCAATATELERARQVWATRFGKPPANAKDKAKQMRFLQGRGFAPEIICRVMRTTAGEPD